MIVTEGLYCTRPWVQVPASIMKTNSTTSIVILISIGKWKNKRRDLGWISRLWGQWDTWASMGLYWVVACLFWETSGAWGRWGWGWCWIVWVTSTQEQETEGVDASWSLILRVTKGSAWYSEWDGRSQSDFRFERPTLCTEKNLPQQRSK